MRAFFSRINGFLFPQQVTRKMDSLTQIRFKAMVIALMAGMIGPALFALAESLKGHYAEAIIEACTTLMAILVLIMIRRRGNLTTGALIFLGAFLANISGTTIVSGSGLMNSLWWGGFPVAISLVFNSKRLIIVLIFISWFVCAVVLHFYSPLPESFYLPQLSLAMVMATYGLLTIAHTALKNRLVRDLERALDEVKTLKGLLPICMYCKNIRNDEGYWQRVEEYIGKRLDTVSFSHGICPDCLAKLEEEYGDDILREDSQEDTVEKSARS